MAAAIHEQYTKEIYDGLGYFAVWMPNSPVALGDVGFVRGRRFHRMTSLADLGIAFETVGPGAAVVHSYASESGVEVSVNGDVATPDVLGIAPQLTVTVTFHRAHTTYLRAVDCTEEAIRDHLALQRGLTELRESGVWLGEYVVVTKLVRTGPAVIMVSSQAATRVEFQASAGDLAPLSLPVGSAGAGVGTSVGSSLAAEAVALDGGLTPFLELSALRRGLSARPRLRLRGPGTGSKPDGTSGGRWELAPLSWEQFAEDGVRAS
ncbi:hypothetical protein [Streptomyces sp. NPDC093223]|uniref:hypothetical protein n=1 Tax=Streptomyces sp. NPDC093223 TaxID=3366033 RepID=UPI00380D4EDB